MRQRTFTILFAIALCLKTANCGFGGHDLFTSLSQLEVLWRNEHEIIKSMQNAIGINENVTNAMQGYIKEHKRLSLDVDPNYDFLGHPLNSYFFIRHVANGWTKIKKALEHVDLNKTTELGRLEKNLIQLLSSNYPFFGRVYYGEGKGEAAEHG